MKCAINACTNHDYQGAFTGDVCTPCYKLIQWVIKPVGDRPCCYTSKVLSEIKDIVQTMR